MGINFLFEVMKLFWNCIVMMVMQLCDYTKTSELYTLKVNFMEYVFYLKKNLNSKYIFLIKLREHMRKFVIVFLDLV